MRNGWRAGAVAPYWSRSVDWRTGHHIDNDSHSQLKSEVFSAKTRRQDVYICICKAVTDTAIRRAVDEGVATLPELSLKTGAGTQCGTCLPKARQVLDEALSERNAPPSTVNLRIVCTG